MSSLKSSTLALSDKQISLVIFFVGMALFTIGLQNQPFIGFESRFALFAKEMLRHGPSFFPTTYGEPYPDYPATATLLTYWLALPFGDVGRLAAAMPTALASALNLALSYQLLAPLSRRWALLTVCFELLTFTFLAEARALSLDQMVTTVTLGSFYLAFSADREQSHDRLRWLPLLLLCGFALRGPLGLVIPAGVVCSYYLLSAQWRRLLGTAVQALLILCIAWGTLLALANHEGGRDFVSEVIRMQVSGRLESKEDLDRWYYLTNSFGNFALAWPIAFVVLLLLARRYQERTTNPELALVVFLAGWVLVVVIGLSIPYTKKARYLLPIAPALSAIAAYPFIARGDRLLAQVRRFSHLLLLILPGLVLIALIIGMEVSNKKGLNLQLPWLTGFLALILCQIAAIASQLVPPTRMHRDTAAAASAALALWLGHVILVEPALRQTHDTRNFVRLVEELRIKQPAPLAFYGMGKDAEAIKYLVNINYDLAPAFFNRSYELEQAPGDLYIVAPSSHNGDLKAAGAGDPIFSGRFDNESFSVFYRSYVAATPSRPLTLPSGKASTIHPDRQPSQ